MADSSMDLDISIDEVFKRSNAIFVRGVDNLSTSEIKNYIKKYSDNDFKIEWINDTSLNVVFEADEHAAEALQKLSKEETTGDETEREAHLIDESNVDGVFFIRISNSNDKKVKNAAQYSRYYLFHPKEEKKSRGYRDREPPKRRRRRSSEDELDLFPEKASDVIRQPDEDTVIEDDSTTNSVDLGSRIGTVDTSRSRIDSKDLDDDDLFK